MAKQSPAKDYRCRPEENNEPEQEIMSLLQARGLEFYISKRCGIIWELRNVYVNESDFLTPRRNSLIYIHDKSPSERQIMKRVKLVDSVFDSENLSSYHEKKPYTLSGKKHRRNGSSCNIQALKINLIL